MPTIIAKEPPVIEIAVEWDGPNRPGLAMNSPSKIVTHEVGNKSPGADRTMHRNFVHNGGGQYQVSFHFVVGPDGITQLLYLDENAWHASDGWWGDGNRDGWGIEHIQIGDFQKTLAYGAWLQAELARNPRRFAIKNPAAFVPDITPANLRQRMVRHMDEAPDHKFCPEMIMNGGYWEPFKAAAVAAASAWREPEKPKPSVPWGRDAYGVQQLGDAKAFAFFGSARNKRAKPLPIRTAADPDAEIIHRVEPGGEVIVRGSVRTKRNRYALVEIPGKPELGVGRTLLSALTGPWPVL